MLTVRRAINVIALTTETLREQLLSEVDGALDELHLQAQQLEFQGRRSIAELQKTNVHRLVEARKEMDAAKEQQDAARQELLERRAQIEALPIDTPVARGQLETTVELHEGDNLAEKMRPAEIVVRDDVIIEIRA